MKKTAATFAFVLFLSLFMTELSYGQAVKFKTTSLSMKVKNNDNRWGDWSDWESASVLIVVNDNRITVYSKEKQVYDVIKNEGKKPIAMATMFGRSYVSTKTVPGAACD